jgi:hypothetical protein
MTMGAAYNSMRKSTEMHGCTLVIVKDKVCVLVIYPPYLLYFFHMKYIELVFSFLNKYCLVFFVCVRERGPRVFYRFNHFALSVVITRSKMTPSVRCMAAVMETVAVARCHGNVWNRLAFAIHKWWGCMRCGAGQDGYVFGGFASDEWHASSVWFGDSRCFLFTLYPKMAVYLSTGLNDHYQYLNQNQKTMPNGMVCRYPVFCFKLFLYCARKQVVLLQPDDSSQAVHGIARKRLCVNLMMLTKHPCARAGHGRADGTLFWAVDSI